jgi:hypothetical protein
MSASVRKFVSRAPRYTLRPTDNSFMRFAQKGEMGNSHITQFVDISMTGLAFITDRETAPFLFEMIKIEVPLANGDQIAWWAKVVRVEAHSEAKWYLRKNEVTDDSKVLVAVQYHDLPLSHREKIKKTVDLKFVEVERQKVAERFKTLSAIWSNYAWQLILYSALIAMTFGILWWFAQPDANYDASRGAPWGQRYSGWLKGGTSEPVTSETGIVEKAPASTAPETE